MTIAPPTGLPYVDTLKNMAAPGRVGSAGSMLGALRQWRLSRTHHRWWDRHRLTAWTRHLSAPLLTLLSHPT